MDQALADLDVYRNAGVDSIIFENDHDLPYLQPPLDEKGIALLTKIVKAAREQFDGPIGIQMLEAAPWILVPANHKWYRDWIISSVLVQTLTQLDRKYPEPEENLAGVVVE